MEDKRLRYEDAINAVRGAIAEGMVPGGGACLAYMLRFRDELREQVTDEDEAMAVEVLMTAMEAPIIQISKNAGLLGALVLEKVKGQEWGYGLNAKTLEYEDLLEAVCTPPLKHYIGKLQYIRLATCLAFATLREPAHLFGRACATPHL